MKTLKWFLCLLSLKNALILFLRFIWSNFRSQKVGADASQRFDEAWLQVHLNNTGKEGCNNMYNVYDAVIHQKYYYESLTSNFVFSLPQTIYRAGSAPENDILNGVEDWSSDMAAPSPQPPPGCPLASEEKDLVSVTSTSLLFTHFMFTFEVGEAQRVESPDQQMLKALSCPHLHLHLPGPWSWTRNPHCDPRTNNSLYHIGILNAK